MNSHLLFLFFSLMTIFIRTSISQGDSNGQNPICAPLKFNCGRISSITYPFSIEGRPENCSYPGFNLTCNNNSPEMEIGSKTYFVKAIDYDSQMLTIVDTDVNGKDCSLRASSSTLDFSRFAYTPNDVNLTFYYNCSNLSRNSSLNLAPCMYNESISSYYMVGQGPDPYENCLASVFTILDSSAS